MNVAEPAGRPLRRTARKIVSTVREMHYWQRRMMILRMAPDRYLPAPHRAPETYQEFLVRTSAPLLCEPSSRARLAGRPVS
ncbi:MAG TPA: hypothetical protein VF843_16350 [Streptosporangiaceae bacterium]